MKRTSLLALGLLMVLVLVVTWMAARTADPVQARITEAGRFDISRPLAELYVEVGKPVWPDCESGCGVSPEPLPSPDRPPRRVPPTEPAVIGPVAPASAVVEQTAQGERTAVPLLESFNGHGFGLVGPQGTGAGNNPSDNSLAVGPNHIAEIVNTRLAVYSKKGEVFDTSGTVLFGPISTNVLFSGFGGECERAPNGDAVVRYDQLADRWFWVMPLFRRAPSAPGEPPGKYGMCYALSTTPNPLGPYHRYYFERELFPDYPRPAIWPDGYYIPTSTGDNLLPDGRLPEKHACVVERSKMLQGLPAREQCLIISDVNFLNNADIDGHGLPPAGAPNIMMATGGAQLRQQFADDGIYVWKMYVDWENQANTRAVGPTKITVAPYHFLCDGQLTRCVPQPGTDMRLDSQGDKIMQRLVYRNIDGRESLVAVHSVNTAAGAGGVRWYEFRLDEQRDAVLHQQGTYAPDAFYRWMPSPAMDRKGNIGIGYSFGGPPNFAGQRFAGRLADDPPGLLTFHETVLVRGEAAQTNTLRWEDYTTTAMDPVDDCTFWYVGDYLKKDAPSYTTRIGAFRLPGCMTGNISGTTYFDVNHNGTRDPNEPGLPGRQVNYATTRRSQDRLPAPAGQLVTDSIGDFTIDLPADPVYTNTTYTLSAPAPAERGWTRTQGSVAHTLRGSLPMASNGTYTIALRDRDATTHVSFGFVCTVPNRGGAAPAHWAGTAGQAVLARNDQQPAELPARGARGGGRGRGRGGADAGWRTLLNNTRFLVGADGAQFIVQPGPFEAAYAPFQAWLNSSTTGNAAHALSLQLAATTLNLAYGSQSADATIQDPVTREWTAIGTLLTRINAFVAEHPNPPRNSADARTAEQYRTVLAALNANTANVTPATPAACS